MERYPAKAERNWAMFCHFAALAGYLIPFGHILGPLIVWLLKKDVYPLVEDQGKEALNFQLTVTIYLFAALLLSFVMIGVLLLFALALFELIFIVVAAVRSSAGELYRYPLTLRFIR